jgi:hypothetical protein
MSDMPKVMKSDGCDVVWDSDPNYGELGQDWLPYIRVPDNIPLDDAVVVSRARRDRSDANAQANAVRYNKKYDEFSTRIAALEAELAEAKQARPGPEPNPSKAPPKAGGQAQHADLIGEVRGLLEKLAVERTVLKLWRDTPPNGLTQKERARQAVEAESDTDAAAARLREMVGEQAE